MKKGEHYEKQEKYIVHYFGSDSSNCRNSDTFKDNSKDKKDETETTKTEQTTEVKKATEQPTATEKENTRTTAEATDQQNQIPSSTQQAVTTTEKQKPRAFYGIWCDAYKKRTTAQKQAVEYSKYGIDAQVFETTQWSNLNSENGM